MDLQNLDSFNKYLDIISLSITSILTAIVLFKLKFRLDKAAYVIIVIYLVSMTLRVIQNLFEKKNNPIVLVLWPISSNLIFAILFYFVYEM
jgi:hypothetical protein